MGIVYGTENFFNGVVTFAMQINAHFGRSDNHIIEHISSYIVDEVLNSTPHGHASVTSTVGSCFKVNVIDNSYSLKVSNKAKFHILMGQVALGSSFKMTSEYFACHRTNGSLVYIGSISEREVSRYKQALAAMIFSVLGTF